ncbi:UDP-N-acetylmuramoyl-L-alanyl-D-glutamate--2,6-diaminopimelate ligase [Paenisporosarcina indica]|uniref:UDP-N-acetylmuramoyl-L-alanyl-D-glutamate--2, 6-diaminopimelate ligase n=1 Tax=Paenisporosarcina indica TaxID=650093 RepID=UPI00094F5CA2|nr:UDP-N-acetylmuramoyl-L-alanyl-D-glutamate--2,6-diaminopimelate ligase [Paenisporosarcina indica]
MDIHWTHLPLINMLQIYGPSTQHTSGIEYDSREVQYQSAFFCIIGEETDGHIYIEEAIQNGASTVVGSDKAQIESYVHAYPYVTFLLVHDSREALAHVAVEFNFHACDELIKIGVTGTNGKTTVATYVRDLFNLVGIPCGMLGTNGIYTSTEKLSIKKSTPTTPMSSDLQTVFNLLVTSGDKAASMEVSSIALDQHRVSGFEFDVAIHTNFSEEHMEYHKTLDHYKMSKLKLFKQSKASVINLDDFGMGQDILQVVQKPFLTYSKNVDSSAHLIWTNIQHQSDGMSFDLLYKGESHRISVPIFGEYNVANLVSAIGAALLIGVSLEDILFALPKMQQVDGRFQVIHGPESRKIVLDYAHTPVALDAIMKAVRKLPHNRLITLIAGIGIRDFAKMPKMAKTAEGKAEVIVVTVDHPGNNNPWVVVDAVLSGFEEPFLQEVHTAPSRKEAVIKALEVSQPGDIVLLTSGCINGCQIVRGEHIPHSDEQIINDFFSKTTLSV